jgi:mono/diheme cytochrome c family protein
MRVLKSLIVLIVLVVIGLGIWIWSGTYNIGADSPHWAVTSKLINVLRERSIDTRAAQVAVPSLDDPALIKRGAEHYQEMCTGCHLAPGLGDSELRDGLYPEPPNLTHFAPAPAEAFWIIKHGIKLTAMPAWGKTHDDHTIWAMVAFLQKQPRMSVDEYRQLTADAAQVEGHGAMATPAPAGTTGAMPGMQMTAPDASPQAPAPAISAR